MYPNAYFDALVVKVHQDGRVINKAIHLALGINLAGNQELLGMCMTQIESSKFWLQVLTELQNRGLKDIFVAYCDGLPEAIETMFPQSTVQLRIVHMVHNSLSYVSYKDRKAIAIARELLNLLDNETISQKTGLSISEIENLN